MRRSKLQWISTHAQEEDTVFSRGVDTANSNLIDEKRCWISPNWESIIRVYEENLCSRCIQIWKDHVILKTQVCNCRAISENQALHRLSLVVTLLQSQNRLLRRGLLVIARRSRGFSQKRRMKTFILSGVRAFYKRCIQELKCTSQRYLEKSQGKRCHVCTEHVSCNAANMASARDPVGQDSACDDTARANGTLCKSEGGSCLPPLTESIALPFKNEECCLVESISALPNSSIVQRTSLEELPRMQETRNFLRNSRGRISRKTRLPPRRPLYLSDAFAIERPLSDPKLIREELLWTEDLLCSFEKLKEELFEKETELSALRERHDSGDFSCPVFGVLGDKFQAEKVRFLEEKIVVLHERQSILLPMVESLASRASALQRRFCKGRQILHLD